MTQQQTQASAAASNANAKNPVLEVQDGTRTWAAKARELEGAERESWWARCVAASPNYAEYQTKTERLIPVFVLEPFDMS